MGSDPRIEIAKAMPMREVIERLPLEGLRRDGRELVGPCPRCGGRDRFGINLDRGLFLCRVCGAKGDGLDLAQHVLGCDFKGALDHLAGAAIEVDPAELARRKARARAERARQEAEAARYREAAIRDAATIWSSARSPAASPVVEYLAARAIRLRELPKSLRFKPDHPYVRKIGGRLVTLHRGPCMIAAIQGPDGRLAAVHQTWIDLSKPSAKAEIVDPETGEAFPAKMVRGSKKAGAIRLGGDPSAGVLVMGEGIETTLSARVIAPLGPAVYWAAVDLGNISGRMLPPRNSGQPDPADDRAFVPPPWVRRLVLIQDGDSDPEATRAKLLSGLRRAQSAIPGLAGEIVHPGAGRDLNDLLRELGDKPGRTEESTT
ncbi:DUF7146 domain-containing protein [Rhodovulum marinum]|uniref:Primase-helicase-like zinc-binding protein n=1 Tax=Rhodovulum marinum TaxID=320662 RepID=A0A4R2Q5M4_9RHOB|nr:primase-helicase zinc-binding domain-containing protein [Rhodovulum marinum]TCP43950.1 primase-helicase-like zinc-binding protein [Rhodovulum marinum]